MTMKTLVSLTFALLVFVVIHAQGQGLQYQITLGNGDQFQLPRLILVGDSLIVNEVSKAYFPVSIDSIAKIRILGPFHARQFSQTGAILGGTAGCIAILGKQKPWVRGYQFIVIPLVSLAAGFIVGGFIGVLYDLLSADHVIDFANEDAQYRMKILNRLLEQQELESGAFDH